MNTFIVIKIKMQIPIPFKEYEKENTVKNIYTEINTIINVTHDDKVKECYQKYQNHLISLLAPEFQTPMLYRELKTLWYNYTKLSQTFLAPIVKSLANNCSEYIDTDILDNKDNHRAQYLTSIKNIILACNNI